MGTEETRKRYDILVRRSAGKFILTIPDLGLKVSAPDFAKAYDQIDAERTAAILKLSQEDLEMPIFRKPTGKLKIYLEHIIKTLLSVIVVIIAIIALLNSQIVWTSLSFTVSNWVAREKDSNFVTMRRILYQMKPQIEALIENEQRDNYRTTRRIARGLQPFLAIVLHPDAEKEGSAKNETADKGEGGYCIGGQGGNGGKGGDKSKAKSR